MNCSTFKCQIIVFCVLQFVFELLDEKLFQVKKRELELGGKGPAVGQPARVEAADAEYHTESGKKLIETNNIIIYTPNQEKKQ